jgi:serine/threonine protein kinase
MFDPTNADRDNAGAEWDEWVDDVADRFEAAWQSLTPPVIVSYLGEATGTRRLTLLAELVKVDMAYRRRLGEKRRLEDYLGDFPELSRPGECAGRLPPTPDPAPGSTVPPQDASAHSAGDGLPRVHGYEILTEAGRGGMGVVYKARQVGLNRLVALKMILSGPFTGAAGRDRFRAEAEAAARLQHPNIVSVYEVGEQDGRPFIALEWVDGGSLAQRLGGIPQPARWAAALAETLSGAVQYGHEKGIVHRDLKPANVLLTPAGVPKITDFGLAKQIRTEDPSAEGGVPPARAYQTQTGEILGTPSYMAPEQAEGRIKEIGPAADVYALGAILYECLTGRPPFRGETTLDTLEQVRTQEPVPPSRLQPRLPRDLGTICLKALTKSPARRYGTAAELADDLRRFLDGRPITARPVGRVEKVWRLCQRNPRVALLTVLVATSLLAGASATAFVLAQSQERAREVLRQQRNTARRRYISDMRLAATYWDAARIGWLLDRLEGQHPRNTGGEDLRGFEWYYWHNRCHSMRIFPGRALPWNTSVAYSPDGSRIARGGDPTVRVLDTGTGQEVLSLGGRAGTVIRVAFSADGKWLATVREGGPVQVWDAHSGALIRTLKGSGCAAFHPDGRRLACGSHDRSVRVWDVTDGRELLECVPRGQALSLAFSPDGQRLAVGGIISDDGIGHQATGEITIWDLAAARRTSDLIGHTHKVEALAFSPDGKRLASASADRTARLWDAATGKELLILREHEGPVYGVAFSPDGRQLASGSADQTVRVWDAASGAARRG